MDMETIKTGADATRDLNIDIEFWKLFFIAVFIGSFGGLSSYMSKIYNKSRSFSFLDLIASFIVGMFGGLVGISLWYYLNLPIWTIAPLSGVSGTLSMTLLRTISEHEGDLIKKVINFILRK